MIKPVSTQVSRVQPSVLATTPGSSQLSGCTDVCSTHDERIHPKSPKVGGGRLLSRGNSLRGFASRIKGWPRFPWHRALSVKIPFELSTDFFGTKFRPWFLPPKVH